MGGSSGNFVGRPVHAQEQPAPLAHMGSNTLDCGGYEAKHASNHSAALRPTGPSTPELPQWPQHGAKAGCGVALETRDNATRIVQTFRNH